MVATGDPVSTVGVVIGIREVVTTAAVVAMISKIVEVEVAWAEVTGMVSINLGGLRIKDQITIANRIIQKTPSLCKVWVRC